MTATEWVAVDVETTGFKPPRDRITEFGAVRIVEGIITDEFQMLVNPERDIPEDIQKLTGITNEMGAGKPTIAEAAPLIRDWIDDAVVFAHNAVFDQLFIDTHFKEVFGHTPGYTWICTLRLCRRSFKTLESHKLAAMCEALNIQHDTQHRALSDARATAHVLLRTIEIISPIALNTADRIQRYIESR